ncbi:MAG: right-handed parallel beta-helix repeat-containing protein [Verrucomicrobiota bacterium]
MQDALAVAQAGDEIRVAEGIYRPDEGGTAVNNSATESFVLGDKVTVIGGFEPGKTNGASAPSSFPTILSGDIDQNDSVNGLGVVLAAGDQVGTNSEHVVQAVSEGSANLLGVVVTGGDATTASINHAGGVLVIETNFVMKDCWLVGNRAAGRGGALHLNDSVAEITNCRFSGNFATARGGAVGTISGTIGVFTNCAIWGNESQRGGGLNFNNSAVTLLNVSISGNHGTVNGGGYQAASSATVSVVDSIIWRNRAGTSETSLGASTNLLSGATDTFSNSIVDNQPGLDDDPQFISEFDPTLAPGTGGNLRLTRGSPALNGAGSTLNTSGVDLDGNQRLRGVSIDLGAFEFAPFEVYVDDTALGANNGSSWGNAYETLQSALTGAMFGDHVVIAEGVYRLASVGDSFEIPEGVALLGGYPNGGGARDAAVHLSILSGDVGGDDLNGDGNFIAEDTGDIVGVNAQSVISTQPLLSLSALTVLDGLVVTAGQAVPAFGNPVVPDETSQGGGAYFDGDEPLVRDCLFSGNLASQYGGAVYVQLSNAGPIAEPGPMFESCRFVGNRCLEFGGVLGVEQGRAVFEDCEFEGNLAAAGDVLATKGLGARMVLERCRLVGNGNGSSAATVLLTTDANDTEFVNCLLSGNEGTVISHLCAALVLRGTTIAGNDGRPVFNNGFSFEVWNSIFWNNSFDYFAQTSILPNVNHSLFEGWVGDEAGFQQNGNLDGTDSSSDPDFLTELNPASAPTAGGDYRLNFDSPMMSAGEDGEVGSTLDLDGNARISGHTVDLGCYEYVLPDADGDGLSDAFELAHTTPASATSLSANSNGDGDSFIALEEFAFGLDPNEADGTGAVLRTRMTVPEIGLFELFWTPNPAAEHYVLITAESSDDLGQLDPWFETATRAGESAGEFSARTQTSVPPKEREFLRLRVEN